MGSFGMRMLLSTGLVVYSLLATVTAKIHLLALTDESRRNILLSKFGYNPNGTFDFVFSNFTVPEAVISPVGSSTHLIDDATMDRGFGVIGFTLSRSSQIAEDIRMNPHICQLQQHDQGLDALFLTFDFNSLRLLVVRSGELGRNLELCHSADECPLYPGEAEKTQLDSPTATQPPNLDSGNPLAKVVNGIFGSRSGGSEQKGDEPKEYRNYVPMKKENGQYRTAFGIRFRDGQQGLYHFIYHNCFNYRAHGYSDKVAVDFEMQIVERNPGSYLSAGDIPKPQLYLYISFLFALTTCLWVNVLCKSERVGIFSAKNVYRVHKLMTALVMLKALSLFFHGMNFYYVGLYGQQREFWAIVYYVTHLLKGALLFGTIILIGTGYTFFKNFLTERDRNLFMVVLPLQIVDNIAMVIIEESEFGEQRYYFWFEIFIFLDLVCCMAILLPIIWSMRHLQEGARTDGKAAFNLEKLHLFRTFYVIVISYIYLTRITKFIVEYMLPFNLQWLSEATVELATLFFFVLVGMKFRPIKSNPYLRLSQQDGDEDLESGIPLTPNGLFENIQRVQRTGAQEEIIDIPGTIGGRDDDAAMLSDDDEADGDDTMLPKTGRKLASP